MGCFETCLRNIDALGGYATILGKAQLPLKHSKVRSSHMRRARTPRRATCGSALRSASACLQFAEQLEQSARYDDKNIEVPFKEKGGKKAKGKWFSNKKLEVKGIELGPPHFL